MRRERIEREGTGTLGVFERAGACTVAARFEPVPCEFTDVGVGPAQALVRLGDLTVEHGAPGRAQALDECVGDEGMGEREPVRADGDDEAGGLGEFEDVKEPFLVATASLSEYREIELEADDRRDRERRSDVTAHTSDAFRDHLANAVRQFCEIEIGTRLPAAVGRLEEIAGGREVPQDLNGEEWIAVGLDAETSEQVTG